MTLPPLKKENSGNYNINHLGLNYRMSEMESAVGIDELKSIKNKNISSKKIIIYFLSKINKCKNFKILNTKSDKKYKSSYYALTIILKNIILCKEIKLFKF